MADEKAKILNERQKLFIKRERIRRELLKIKPHEGICLNGEQVAIVVEWIKELEGSKRK